MTEFESARSEDAVGPPSQSFRSKGIPALGTGYDNRINWKGVTFIGSALVIAALALFWWRGGFSSKKPAANTVRDEVVTIPEAPKKAPLTAAASLPKLPASAPDDYAAKGPDDTALAIELRRKRTGMQLDANGKPIATAQNATNQATAEADSNKFIYKQYGSNKSISKIGLDLSDPTQSLVKRRAVDSGGVAIYLGGNFLPKGGPATSQFANMESARGATPGADPAVGTKGEQLPGSGGSSGGSGSAGLAGSGSNSNTSPGANPSTNQLISDILNANNRERELTTGKEPSQESEQPPQLNSRSSISPINNKSADVKVKVFPTSLARNVPINPSLYLAQGTLIRCVLQTVIISDFDGPTICNIAEDIRSFDSNIVLIPKGSRVIGDFKAQQNISLDRVAIVWKRLITPDNIDIAIDSPGTSPLGAMGVGANVDNRIMDRILPALFVSLASDAFKIALIKRGPTVKKSYIDPASGRAVLSEEPFESITVRNAENFAAQQLASKLNAPARLTVLQGQLVNIFTTQDLDFSAVYARR